MANYETDISHSQHTWPYLPDEETYQANNKAMLGTTHDSS